MLFKLPLRLASTRVKSPAAHPRPRPPRRLSHSPPPSSARRSRSHDPGRRASPSTRYPPSARRPSRAGQPSPERHRSPDRRHGRRRRRRDSSSSPERYERSPRRVDRDYLHDDLGRPRPSSHAPGGRDPRRMSRERPASEYYPTPPRVRPGAAPSAFYREGENDPRRERRRSSTPERYKPTDRYKDTRPGEPGRRPSHSARQDSPAPAKEKQDAAASKPEAKPAAATAATPSSSASNFLGQMPTAFAAYAGINAVTKNADIAKEWISWLNDLGETPEEIQSMSAKATTARDTITQVQRTLKARPDLLDDGEVGEQLKEQIEDAIADTDKALGKMTKLLSEISKKGDAENGNVVNGMQEFWRSYRYKEEFEGKVKQADEELQKEMTTLSTLMVNIYSRSLMKPVPPGPGAAVPPPAPKPEADGEKKQETKQDELQDKDKEDIKGRETPLAANKAVTDSARFPVPEIVEPESSGKKTTGSREERMGEASGTEKGPTSLPPRSPSYLADEEAALGSTPASLSREEDAKANVLLTPGSSTTTAFDDKPRDERAAPREARGNISEQEAHDALLDAAWDGDLDGAARALRHVSHSCCDLRGLTPLHLAAERDNLAVAILLLDRGADVHSRSDGGRTPLHLASRSASASMVEMLLERARADPNAQTSKGRTPLHYAASKAEDGDEERREVLRVLRDWGADPEVEDRGGETARDVAQKRGHWDAAATLRRAEKRWEEEHRQGWRQRHGFMK